MVLAVVSAAAVAGCDADTTPGSVGVSASAGASSYDFRVAALEGDTFDGRSLQNKPAVLWFWAPWCPTCLAQAKHVNALAADYAGKASVVGVAGLDNVSAMHDFVRMAKLSGFPQLADEHGTVWKLFGMTAQSTFVVLDADGAVTARGHLHVAELPKALDELLVG